MFPWSQSRRTLQQVFVELQKAAKVNPQGKVRYGFHDIRRAFATMNAARLTPDALQALMQHKGTIRRRNATSTLLGNY
jgi:integrase